MKIHCHIFYWPRIRYNHIPSEFEGNIFQKICSISLENNSNQTSRHLKHEFLPNLTIQRDEFRGIIVVRPQISLEHIYCHTKKTIFQNSLVVIWSYLDISDSDQLMKCFETFNINILNFKVSNTFKTKFRS